MSKTSGDTRTGDTGTARLARYIVDMNQAALPRSTVERAKLHILDTLGAVVSGYALKAGQLARRLAESEMGPPEASLAISDHRVPAAMAAFANAMAAHADETDDAHPTSITHPGCAVVPAALAACELFGRSGMDLIRAVTLGYDFCARTGQALGAGRFLTEKCFDPHAFGGTIGAGAASAFLAGLGEREAAWALSYAVQQTSGVGTVFRDRDHVEKAFVFAGKPARDGLTSALLVSRGFTAVDDAFDGEWNFWTAFGAPEPWTHFDTLGRVHEIEHTNIKRWSVGSPIQAALDSVDALHAEAAIDAGAIDRIEVRLPVEGARVVDNRNMPSVNLQHLVALMIVDGHLGFQSSHDQDRMRDPRVAALRERVLLVPDEELSKAEPSRQAIVTITYRDGSSRRHHTTAVRGTTDNPMSWEEVVTKARDLMRPTLDQAQTEAVIAAVGDLENAASIDNLVEGLTLR